MPRGTRLALRNVSVTSLTIYSIFSFLKTIKSVFLSEYATLWMPSAVPGTQWSFIKCLLSNSEMNEWMDASMNLIVRQKSCDKTSVMSFSVHICKTHSWEPWDDCAQLFIYLCAVWSVSCPLPGDWVFLTQWSQGLGDGGWWRARGLCLEFCLPNRPEKVKAKNSSPTLSLLLKPVKEMTDIKQNLLFLTL